ncbi:MAG: DUF3604 domain-containing protein [Oscillospiraceae bacterium]|nr:DUF3604 domain-containing protein [Oscillospiraceae bacterium]
MIHNQETGARNSVEKITEIFREETGCALICGFDRAHHQIGAASDSNRPAGFMEAHISTEYKLALNTKKPLILISDAVKLNGAGKVCFALSVGFGNGSPLPQPSGRYNIYVNDTFCVSVRNVNYSFYWRGENGGEFAFSMRRCETAPPYTGMTLSPLIQNEGQAAFGIGLLTANAELIQDGQPAKITIEAVSNYQSEKYIYVSTAFGIIHQSNIWSALEILKTKNIRQSSGYSVYFGDIHTHSGQVRERELDEGCGMGSMNDNYIYAKGAGGLHFYALTDHETQILPDYEDAYFALADTHNKNGEFVCIKAFEHTSLIYGHRNVYFKDEAKVINGLTLPTHPHELIASLDGYEFFTVPHHTSSASHPFNTALLTEKDRCVEVYSVWGSSEYCGDFPRGVSDRHDCYWVSDILKEKNVVGILASADGHDGCPGNAQSPYPKHQHQFHFCGSGLTAVLCGTLTREAVYEALYNRRCYGTTGAPIILEFTCGDYIMGDEIFNQTTPPVFAVSCKGTNSIKEIRIVKNGSIHYIHPCCSIHDITFTYTDENYDGKDANYYVRVVQTDMESAWSSPIFFINA